MLQLGSRGSDVAALQRALGLTPDGIYGPKTRQSVLHRQRVYGLKADGVAGPQTLRALGLSELIGGGSGGTSSSSSARPSGGGGGGGQPMLRQGSRGSAVADLQRKLGITADGVFGPQTARAVRDFQRSHGLSVDGVVGPQTWGALGGGGSGGGGGGGGSGSPSINAEEMARKYGWALSVLNSDPELKSLFDKAVAGSWAPDKFLAELRNTGWFKRNGEAMRQAIVLKNSDPATWNQRLSGMKSTVARLAAQMGANVGGGLLDQIADQALSFAWNDDQLKAALGSYVNYQDGHLFGAAAQTEDELRRYAADMGVRIADNTILDWVKKSVSGAGDINSFKSQIQNMAASAFPPIADRIKAGETVADIASPYKQGMAQILELNPESVDLYDPTIRSALAGQTKDGEPAMKSIWQFENDLRKDPRWTKTNNAREAGMATTRQVLTDMGLSF